MLRALKRDNDKVFKDVDLFGFQAFWVDETKWPVTMRKMKKGLGKYKGNLIFKWFNYGKVGHYASRCPEKKKNEYDPREKFRKIQKNREKAIKKSFYIHDSNSFASEGN